MQSTEGYQMTSDDEMINAGADQLSSLTKNLKKVRRQTQKTNSSNKTA